MRTTPRTALRMLHQCPGCWGWSSHEEDRTWECECGERLTRIDLRNPEAEAAARERLNLAKDALVRTGYFTRDQVGDDVAPRIIELWSACSRDAAPRTAAGRDPATILYALPRFEFEHDGIVSHVIWLHDAVDAMQQAEAAAPPESDFDSTILQGYAGPLPEAEAAAPLVEALRAVVEYLCDEHGGGVSACEGCRLLAIARAALAAAEADRCA